MATYLIDSKADIARSQSIMQAIDDGLLPHPPTGTQRLNICELNGCETVLRRHVKGHGECCLDCAFAMDEWQEVLDLVGSMSIRDAQRIYLHDAFCSVPEQQSTVGYDPTCGMKSDTDFLLDIWEQWMRLEVETVANLDVLTWGEAKVSYEKVLGKDFKHGFEYIVDKYLASHHWPRLLAKSNLQHVVVDDDMWPWFVTEAHDRFARWHYPVKFTCDAPQPSPAPRSEAKQHTPRKEPSKAEKACRRLAQSKGHWDAMWNAQQHWLDDRRAGEARRDEALLATAPKPTPILPQLLQSNEDILERIAMNNVKPHPDRLSELCEACAYGVEHYADEEARTIFDGFYLQKNELGTRILLRHRDHPNHVAVGETDIVTGAMVYAGERPAIREYMAKVIAGMRPATSGHLPGVMVQALIAEEDKQEPLRSGHNQHAEVVPDELPLFAGENSEPEPAA